MAESKEDRYRKRYPAEEGTLHATPSQPTPLIGIENDTQQPEELPL